MIISKELRAKINYLTSNEGGAALEDLGKALYEYYTKQCILTEGNQVYREQGAARLAEYLINLPKSLRNASDATRTG